MDVKPTAMTDNAARLYLRKGRVRNSPMFLPFITFSRDNVVSELLHHIVVFRTLWPQRTLSGYQLLRRLVLTE